MHPIQLGLCLMSMLGGNVRAFWLIPLLLQFIINSEGMEEVSSFSPLMFSD